MFCISDWKIKKDSTFFVNHSLTLQIMFFPSYRWKENSDINRSMNLEWDIDGTDHCNCENTFSEPFACAEILQDIQFIIERQDRVLNLLKATSRVAVFVKGWRPEADSHRVWKDHHHAPRHRRLPRDAHLERKLSRILIEATGMEKRQHVPHCIRFQHFLSSYGCNTPVGKGGPDHRDCLAGDLHATALVPQAQAVLEMGARGEALVLLKTRGKDNYFSPVFSSLYIFLPNMGYLQTKSLVQ